MDYYQGVVTEYLRADRSLFINTEYCIQLKEGNPDTCGRHSSWYCDAVAANLGSNTIFLCEVSYAAGLQDLIERLKDWNENWQGVCDALARDSHLNSKWTVRPWLFVPEDRVERLTKGLERIGAACGQLNFKPIITTLEMVQPWKYNAFNRCKEESKPTCIPPEMQI